MPRVGGGRPSGLPLGFSAGVGTAVEAPAGGALVDLPGAVCQRLAQAGRVTAGVLALVGRGGSVDAAVGHPAGRHPGPASRATRGASRWVNCRVCEHLLQVEVGVELLELSLAHVLERLLDRVAQGAGCGLLAARAGAMTATCRFVGVFGWGWVGRSDDRAVLLRGSVKRFELAVRDPDELREQLIQPVEIPVAEHLPPPIAQAAQDGRVDDAVVGARLQIRGRAPGHVACERSPCYSCCEELFGEGGQDHVGDRGCERVADEPPAQRGVRVLADAVGFHARLLEQPPVDGELPLARIG